MRVLVVGATGYVGAVVAERLAGTGHDVVALVRSGSRAASLPATYEVRTGDLTAPGTLTTAVTPDIDAVVHAGAPTGDPVADAAAVEALLAPLRGTGRAFLYTSGVWVLGPTGTGPADESTPTDPIALVGDRPAVERSVLEAAGDGVRGVVLRPGVVHGRGGGIPALLVDLARTRGQGRYVGGPVRWPMVDVDDLADLYVAALERARPGTVLHGVAEQAVPVTELARAAAVAAGVGPGADVWPIEEARAALGHEFADALALDQWCNADRTQAELGWRPSRVGAVVDVATDSYATDAVVAGTAVDAVDDAAVAEAGSR